MHDGLSERTTSPSPRSSRGEGWGEGLLPQISVTKCVRGESPSPGLLRNLTSPRKRGEVTHLEHRQALRFPTTRERFVECCDLILIEHKIAGRGVFGRVFHS